MHMKVIAVPAKAISVILLLERIPGSLGIAKPLVCPSLKGQSGRESLMALNICSLSFQHCSDEVF